MPAPNPIVGRLITRGTPRLHNLRTGVIIGHDRRRRNLVVLWDDGRISPMHRGNVSSGILDACNSPWAEVQHDVEVNE